MHDDAPAAPAVRDMLERVLRSETFSRSERSRELLRYLVEREQAGDRERLKGFNIAMDVFGKDTQFDPSTDAVVRVQAGRLRELLTQYYESEGAADPLKVFITRGGYVPSYRSECPDPLEEQADAPQAAPTPAAAGLNRLGRARALLRPASDRIDRHIQMMWAAMAVVVLLLGLVAARLAPPGMPDGAPNVGGPLTASIGEPSAIETLPAVHVRSDAGARAVADAVRSGLAGFDTVGLMLRDDQTGDANGTLDFAFSLTSSADGENVSVVLSNAATGKVLTARMISTGANAKPPLADQVADLLSSTVPASGVLYGYVEQNGLQAGLVECLLLNDDYYLDQDEAKHRKAYECFERLVDSGTRSPLVYSELAALHLEAVTDGYAYPTGATEEQAFVLARRGVKMGPTSPYAHRALGFLFGRTGNGAESVRWMRKAYELNTYDLSMAAAYGYALVFAGDYHGGEPIMTRAVEASSAHASWWDYGLFLARFMLDDRKGAARAAEPLVGAKRQHYLGTLAIVADTAGDTVRAAALISELTKTYPKFAADPAASLKRANYPADLVTKFVAALRAAGLGSAS